MIIKRIIKGDEIGIELTSEELFYAYLEQIEIDIAKYIGKVYSVPYDKIDEVVDRIEDALERDHDFWECYWTVAIRVCEDMGLKMRKKLEEEK